MFCSTRENRRPGRIAALAGAAAFAGATALGGLVVAGTAQAMPDDHPDFDRYCKPQQVDVTIGPLTHATMHEGADVRFTAKPGQSCLLGGAPSLSFLDARGEPLDITAEYPPGQAPVHTVDAQHPVAAAFSYQKTDPNTGSELPGPTPAAVDIAFPAPLGAYTVTVPWNGATVPGPVSVTAVNPVQG